jgi:hypothetical protein
MQNYIVTLSQLFFLSTITYYYYFGEMEQNSLPRRGFPWDGQKSGNHVCEKRLSSKTDTKRIPHRKLHFFALFYPFFPIFMTFYISQHYGRHVTTSLLRHPEHKGNPAELGGRTPKK